MSALTDRITEVLREHEIKYEVWSEFACECGVDGWETYQEWRAHVAEAVEAELGLTEEIRNIVVDPHWQPWNKRIIGAEHRWVSTWSPVPEEQL